MKMLKLGLVLALGLMLTACGDDKKDTLAGGAGGGGSQGFGIGQNTGVYGTWGGMPPMLLEVGGERMNFNFVLRLQSGSIANLLTCTFEDGTIVNTGAVAPAEISATEIRILQSVEHSEVTNGHRCTASIKAAVVSYQVNQNDISLTLDGKSLNLKRQ